MMYTRKLVENGGSDIHIEMRRDASRPQIVIPREARNLQSRSTLDFFPSGIR
jgi:hypothetical protein